MTGTVSGSPASPPEAGGAVSLPPVPLVRGWGQPGFFVRSAELSRHIRCAVYCATVTGCGKSQGICSS